MHRLAKACIQYSTDHEGQWPDSLQQLAEYGITEKELVNPCQPEREIGYVYLKPTGTSAAPEQILIHEAYAQWEDGINVAFAHGRVKFIADEKEFENLLQKATTR